MASLRGDTLAEWRIPSANGRFIASFSQARVTLTDQRGQILVSDDYHDRDYHPDRGRWTRSGRFYVYSLSSQGGHSPWHRPFVVADTLTRRTYTDSDLCAGEAVTKFQLSGRDTLSCQVLDRTGDNWEAGVPGLPRRFGLAEKVAKLPPVP